MSPIPKWQGLAASLVGIALLLAVGIVGTQQFQGTALAMRLRISPSESGGIRIAVIGDYGDNSQAEADVAALVRSWQPDLVVTTGDNNYPSGAADTIDDNIGQYYHEFIAPYQGQHGEGADVNRFFPTLGNHDWDTRDATTRLPQPYLDYFTLPQGPGEERYYDLIWGPVHIFALDSDYREPDGNTVDSVQADWLQRQMQDSTVPWKLVFTHEPPYSSGWHGSSPHMRWPYEAWGATAVLAGHDHTYERVLVDGFPYFVNGTGGSSRYWFLSTVAGSQVRYNEDSGAMMIEADSRQITFRFVTRTGLEIDRYTIVAGGEVQPKGLTSRSVSTSPPRPEPLRRPSQRRVR